MRERLSEKICGFLLLIGILLVVQSGSASEYPEFVGYVNDYAHLISAPQASALNQELRDFDNRTTIEVAVLTVDSIGNENPEDYAIHLGDTWGVGKRDKNNGIIVLVAMQSHEIWIEVGPGLSGQISDQQVQQIVDDVIIPQFRSDRPDLGVINGVHSIINHFEGSGTLETGPIPASSRNEGIGNSNLLLIAGAVFLLALVIILLYLILAGYKFNGEDSYQHNEKEEEEPTDQRRATTVNHNGFGSSGEDSFGGGDMGGGSHGGGKW